MQRQGRKIVIAVIAVIIVFAVMVAALLYNPQAKGNAAGLVTVRGSVVDDSGQPLDDMTVFSVSSSSFGAETTTDASGRYELSFDLADGSGSAGWSICATDQSSGHWTEITSIDFGNARSLEMNFTLQRAMNLTVPLGMLAYFDIINGSTRVSMSANFGELFMEAERTGSPAESMSLIVRLSEDHDTTLSWNWTEGGSVVPCMNVTMVGTYNASGNISVISCIQADDPYLVPIGADYLDYRNVSSGCTIYDLIMGQNRTVGVIQPYGLDDHLPASPYLDFSFDLLGENVTVRETQLLTLGLSSPDDSDPFLLKVIVEPLTIGTHTYAVYTEGECVLHVWELDAQP